MELVETLCSDDAKKSIKKILDHVISRNVLKQLSWSGKRTTKPSFENVYRRIVRGIHAGLERKFKDFTYSILEKKVQALLQGAEFTK